MDPEAARIEHLKLVQAVIARLARSSFAVKSGATAASAALVAFVASADTPLASMGGVAILSLWMLDATFLRQERNFRRLYNLVRMGQPCVYGAPRYFTMDVSIAVGRPERLLNVAVSSSLSLMYVPLLALVGLSGLVTALTTMD